MPPEGRMGSSPDASRLTRDRLLLRALACALVAVAVLRPPETYAWSAAVCGALLAAAGCLAWVFAGGSLLLPAWTAGLLPLVLAAIAAASCRARAVDEAGGALALVLAALLGRALVADGRARHVIADVLVALGAVAAVLAVLQHHVIYPEELKGLLAAPDPTSP